jgi:hypothetical protein
VRKGRKAVALISALVLIVAFAALLGRDREPRYQGRPLHEWVNILDSTSNRGPNAPPQVTAAERAVQHVGTNAIPFLLRWIVYEWQPSKSKQSIANFAFKIPFSRRLGPVSRWLYSGDSLRFRASAAVNAFEALGPDASPAVPELTRIATTSSDQGPAHRAVDALCGIGSVGVPGLLGVMTNKHAVARFYTIISSQRLGTNAISVIPTLILCLKDREVAAAAFEALGRLKLEPQLVVPVLVDTVHHPDALMRSLALITLGDYGHEARFAVPAILPALADKDESVREYARSLLQAIAPEVLTNAPTH